MNKHRRLLVLLNDDDDEDDKDALDELVHQYASEKKLPIMDISDICTDLVSFDEFLASGGGGAARDAAVDAPLLLTAKRSRHCNDVDAKDALFQKLMFLFKITAAPVFLSSSRAADLLSSSSPFAATFVLTPVTDNVDKNIEILESSIVLKKKKKKKVKKKKDKKEKLEKTSIMDVANRLENKKCSDCGSTNPPPTWASSNIGCFFCIRCSGAHRQLGAHVSKVLSVNLDDWKPELIEFMASMGNERVNSIYKQPCIINNETCSQLRRNRIIAAKYLKQPLEEIDEVDEVVNSGVNSMNERIQENQLNCGVAVVTVVAAEDLAAGDVNGSSDPYVVVKLCSSSSSSSSSEVVVQHRTRTIMHSLSPVFNDTLVFNVKSEEQVFRLSVYDYDRLTRDDLLGEVKECLKASESCEERWMPLDTKGRVLVRLDFTSLAH